MQAVELIRIRPLLEHLLVRNLKREPSLSVYVALYGPLHGGANEAVLKMLEEIGSVSKVPQFIAEVKERRRKLMGFGHRIYRSYDPRARIIQVQAKRVFEVTGREPLIDIAMALEAAALADPYFTRRRLYPNVDFYSGLIYRGILWGVHRPYHPLSSSPHYYYPHLLAL